MEFEATGNHTIFRQREDFSVFRTAHSGKRGGRRQPKGWTLFFNARIKKNRLRDTQAVYF
jgi:hypothetical protein